MGALGFTLSPVPFGVCAFRFPRQPQALFKTVIYVYIYIYRNLHIQYEFPEEFPTFIVWQILLIQPGVSNDNRNDNETITKNSKNPCRPDDGTSLAEKQLFLAHLARPNEQQASTRLTRHGRAQVFPE